MGPNETKVTHLLQSVDGRDHLHLDESMSLIQYYGFPVPDYRLAHTPEEAVQAWHSIKSPIAMKVNRPHASHKTDNGFVRLDLNSERGIRHAFEVFHNKVVSQELEVLIQPMLSQGRELILGGKQDEVFGPVILFGLGGILVEALGGVIWRVAPIGHCDARAMVNQIRGRKVLGGFRGEEGYDTEAIEDLLVRLSNLLVDCPMIQEIDINPVKVAPGGRGVQALDARVILRRQAQ